MSDPIIFGQPYLGDEEVELVTRTLRSSWIGQGPLVAEFERRLAAEIWSEQVVAVSSCTAALELSLLALGIGPGDEVITTPLTFVATVNAIQAVGATPVLADIDPETLLIETAAVEAAITERTRAIIPVSFGGRPLDIDLLLDLARARDLFVVEDAAHAVGAVADGMPVGASRDPRLVTCFSFYPNKNLASAEGGAIALLDEELAGAPARSSAARAERRRVGSLPRPPVGRHARDDGGEKGELDRRPGRDRAAPAQQARRIHRHAGVPRRLLRRRARLDPGRSPDRPTRPEPRAGATPCTSIRCACRRPFATPSCRICATRASAPRCTIPPSIAIRSTGTSRPTGFLLRSRHPTSSSRCRSTRGCRSAMWSASALPWLRRSIVDVVRMRPSSVTTRLRQRNAVDALYNRWAKRTGRPRRLLRHPYPDYARGSSRRLNRVIERLPGPAQLPRDRHVPGGNVRDDQGGRSAWS